MKTVKVVMCALFVMLLASCGGGGGSSEGPAPTVEPIISEKAVVIPEETVARDLLAVSPDQGLLAFDAGSSVVADVKSGDILAIPPSSSAPDGMLRKVETVASVDGRVELKTVPASLCEVIEQGTLRISQTLQPLPEEGTRAPGVKQALIRGARMTSRSAIPGVDAAARAAGFEVGETFHIELAGPDDGKVLFDQDKNPATTNDQVWATSDGVVLYDADGDMETADDQVRVSGSISFGIRFDLEAEFGFFKLETLTFTTTPWEMSEITLTAETNLEASYKKKIYEATFPSIKVVVGGFPVWFTPEVEVYLGCDGKVSVSMTTGAVQSSSVTAGVEYNKGIWAPIKKYEPSFTYTPPQVSASLAAEAYVTPSLALLIYGGGGPYVFVKSSINLDADIAEDPWWCLSAWMRAGVGVEFEVLDKEIVDYEIPDLIVKHTTLAEADGGFYPSGEPGWDTEVQVLFTMPSLLSSRDAYSSVQDFDASNLIGIRPVVSTNLSEFNSVPVDGLVLYPPETVRYTLGRTPGFGCTGTPTSPIPATYKSANFNFYEFAFVETLPAGDWLLKRTGDAAVLARSSFGAAYPYDSEGKAAVPVPRIRLNTDGGDVIKSVDVTWYVYDGNGYVKASDALMDSMASQDEEEGVFIVPLRSNYGDTLALFRSPTWNGTYYTSSHSSVSMPASADAMRINVGYNIDNASYQFLFE